ncbi:NAD(P)-dependent oxidoreductase [Cytophagales bacterium LB-30]|uniref:NAD(P)-dependent oxidoreductase n=1 Tax=Shiella aurantiaca TaxID=3058365 RepID=A0ABT8F3C6_9BACT|nr:NAD(P)-dependent oxidoreductase [Shiella aurantiaca]MDN4164955.1 NAD(P)-dependent oxidoreductase [Shiella aurantiaca]
MISFLLVDELHESIGPLLTQAGFAYSYQPHCTRADILAQIGAYQGIIIRSKTSLDAEFFEHAAQLRVIARAGAGLDQIDLGEVEKRSIALVNTPEGNSDAVGEHALAMLLALFNNITQANQEVKNFIWQREANRGIELMGKTVGLIGCGHMGSAFAKRLSAVGCEVLAYDKYKDSLDHSYARLCTLEELKAKADVLSLHVPLTLETYQMVDGAFLQSFSKNIYLINTARGEVVKTEDLPALLNSGKLQGMALDVLENEKMQKLSDAQRSLYENLFSRSNTLFTPHVAGWTHESYRKINEVMVEKIKKLHLTIE